MNLKLSDIGEENLLDKLKKFMPEDQIIDDTAEIYSKSESLIVNNDSFVENIHFKDSTISAFDLGWKVICANLSDLASSGVDKVIGCTITIVAPKETLVHWIEELYSGIKLALDQYGGNILGGDVSKGKERIISITIFGTKGKMEMKRQYADDGDLIVITGSHGLSSLGLHLINNSKFEYFSKIDPILREKAIEKHRRPRPRMEISDLLLQSKPKNFSNKVACTDTSDGLIKGIQSICKSSKKSAEIDFTKLPIEDKWGKGKFWDDLYLYGGEDYELIIVLKPDWAYKLIGLSPNNKIIGEIKNTKETLKLINSSNNENLYYKNSEFEHFHN